MKDLTIKIKLDRSQAKAAAAEHNSDAHKMTEASAAQVSAQKKGIAEVVAATKSAQRDEKGRFALTGAAAKEAGETTKAAGRAGASGFMELYGAVSLATMGMHKLIGVAREVRDTIQEAARIAQGLNKGFVDERERVAELAAVLGKPADNKFTMENAGFNKRVGMNPTEGLDFRLNFQNTGAQYAGKSMSQKEYEEYEEQSGKMGLARKLAPDVAGDFFAGVLGFKDFSKFGDKASEEALAVGNASIEVLKRGRGDNPVLVRQLAMLNSSLLNEDSLKGVINDPNISAMLISTAAEKSPKDAAETTKAALRGLRDFNGDAAPLLQKAGVDPSMDPITAIRKITPIVEDEARSKNVKVGDVLSTYFHDQLTAEGIGVFINKGVSGGIFKDREDLLAGKIPGMPAVGGVGPAMEVLKGYDESERGQQRKAEATTKEVELAKGASNSRLVTLREQAEGQLKKEGGIDSTSSMLMDNLFWKPMTGWTIDPREMSIEGRMGELIRQRGKAAGVDIDAGALMRYHTAEGMSEQFNWGMDQIKAKGVDPLADLGKKLDANTEATKANTAQQQAAQNKPAGIPPATPPLMKPGQRPAPGRGGP